MDDVLREALVLKDADQMLGPRRVFLEYRGGELYEGPQATVAAQRPVLDAMPAEPIVTVRADIGENGVGANLP